MIKLEKAQTPAWLSQHSAAKTAEYIAAPRGRKPAPWRDPEVIEALRRECRSKCMYCEGIVDDVAYIAVEHIAPKETFPDRVLEWMNLGLACTRCNTNKGSYWAENPSVRILNPYEDDPTEHISFSGPIAVSRYDSSRGENTLRRLKFSERTDLVLSRMRRIEDLDRAIKQWHVEEDLEIKELLAEDVTSKISPEQEFSAALTAYARSRGFPI